MTPNPEKSLKRSRVGRRSSPRLLKFVRRLHLYTGLILLPWVIFFGLSGMLFNHADWFSSVEVLSEKSPDEVDLIHPFPEPDSNQIADELVSILNRKAKVSRYVRVAGSDAVIEGTLTFQGNAGKGSASVSLSPNHGDATVRLSAAEKELQRPDFHGRKLEVSSFDLASTKEVATALLTDAGLAPLSPLILPERGGSELRFSIQSIEDGRSWNVVYSLAGGQLTARETKSPPGMDFNALIGRLHKTHQYPETMGARWLWTLFGDATGATMMFWGLSGLIMWWQMKPTRVLGIAGLSVAAVLAVIIFSGTINYLTFGPTQARRAPESGNVRSTEPTRGESSRETRVTRP